MNAYTHEEHLAVSLEIKGIKKAKWLVSYDDTQEITKIYEGYESIKFNLNHSAHKSKTGKEILIYSKNILIPKNTAIF